MEEAVLLCRLRLNSLIGPLACGRFVVGDTTPSFKECGLMCERGNIPNFPLLLVPDQHQ